jgi:hypothetical protein
MSVEVWRTLTPKRQQQAIDACKIEGPRRDAEYKDANKIKEVPISDFQRYDQLLPQTATHCLYLQCLPWRVAQKPKSMLTFLEMCEHLIQIVLTIRYNTIKTILAQLDAFLLRISHLFIKLCLETKLNI